MRISFDCAADIYDKTRGPPRQVMKQLIETLSNELQGYRTILDTGAGTGRFTKPLQDSGFEVFGIDIAKKMISKAMKKRSDAKRSFENALKICERDPNWPREFMEQIVARIRKEIASCK